MSPAWFALLVGGVLFFLWGAFLNGTSLGPPPDPRDDPFAAAADRGWRKLGPVVWRIGALMLVVALLGSLIEAAV